MERLLALVAQRMTLFILPSPTIGAHIGAIGILDVIVSYGGAVL